jgi:hypothetical protein
MLLAEREDILEDTVPIFSHREGTGGGIQYEYLHRRKEPALLAPAIYGQGELEGSNHQKSPADQLRFIRDALAVTMSDLACLLKVSRPTVYSWLAGDEPREESYAEICRLMRVAKEVDSYQIQRLDRLIKRPMFEGMSLLDKLSAGLDGLAELPKLKELAEKEARSRKSPRGSGKTKDDQGMRNFSTPLYESS